MASSSWNRRLQHDPGVYVILMSGFYSLDNAIAAIKRGAYGNYVPKPVDRSRLKNPWTTSPTRSIAANVFALWRQQLLNDLEFHGIVGRSPAMIDVFEMGPQGGAAFTRTFF